ncbi:MAG: hypothetical protein MEQ84_13670 [Mesorhizobium sp.]|nr:hypothetical protein [Mesorhizobium sp.]
MIKNLQAKRLLGTLLGAPLVRGANMKRLVVSMAAIVCIANGVPASGQEADAEFVGAYDGSSFETYMAMQIFGDGTFEWVLAVGGLDLRSKGVWRARGGEIHFTTIPAPVPPQFRFLRFEERSAQTPEILQVWVSGPSGKLFTNADVTIECANGNKIFGFVAGSAAMYGITSLILAMSRWQSL